MAVIFRNNKKKRHSLQKIGYKAWIIACLVVNPVMVDNVHYGGSVLGLNDGSFFNLFQMVGARLSMSMSVLGPMVILFVVLLCSEFRSLLSPLLCFNTEVLIISVLLRCFLDEIQDPVQTEHITKTCLYNFDPLKPHFYIVKLRFTGVYIIFLISAKKT